MDEWIKQEFIRNFKPLRHEVLLQHVGYLTQDLIFRIVEEMEKRSFARTKSKLVSGTLFATMLEGLQNIRIHGYTDSETPKVGLVYVLKTEDSYIVYFGNLILSSQRSYLEDRIEVINSTSSEELKVEYQKALEQRILCNKKGSGLGFMNICLRTKGPMTPSFFELDSSKTFFIYQVSISLRE